jgi:hypothetical protein
MEGPKHLHHPAYRTQQGSKRIRFRQELSTKLIDIAPLAVGTGLDLNNPFRQKVL